MGSRDPPPPARLYLVAVLLIPGDEVTLLVNRWQSTDRSSDGRCRCRCRCRSSAASRSGPCIAPAVGAVLLAAGGWFMAAAAAATDCYKLLLPRGCRSRGAATHDTVALSWPLVARRFLLQLLLSPSPSDII